FSFSHAEDGIRARNVTGVQTCALPISNGAFKAPSEKPFLNDRPLRNGFSLGALKAPFVHHIPQLLPHIADENGSSYLLSSFDTHAAHDVARNLRYNHGLQVHRVFHKAMDQTHDPLMHHQLLDDKAV